MRMKRSRLKQYYLRSKKVIKDNEGSTWVDYAEPVAFMGEVWAASGKVQAEIYGERLSYIRNVRVDGSYAITTDQKGIVHYVFQDGLDIVESDGVCLYVSVDADPDYKVLSIKPCKPLRMECVKL